MQLAATIAGISCVLCAGTAPAQDPDPFTELHTRAREVEKSLVTLRADFVETTESDLLAEPIVESGTMVASRPMRVLLRYQEPEKKLLLIDGDELRVVWPERGQQERLPIGKLQDAVDKYFYRASEKELRGHFDISVVVDAGAAGTQRVDMIARRKQVKKGLESMHLWVAEDTLYLVKMRLVYPDGAGSKTIELSNLRANVPVEDEEFTVEFPPEASATRTLQ
jgi:outer membrane lipoprotein-sorting protein